MARTWAYTCTLLATVALCAAHAASAARTAAAPPHALLEAERLRTPAGIWMSCFADVDAATGAVTKLTLRPTVGAAGDAGIVSPHAALAAPWLPHEAARGQYNDTIDEVGWSFLSVVTNDAMSNAAQAAGAGYLEGAQSATRIYQYAMNSGANATLPKPVQSFLARSNAWLEEQIQKNPGSDYWQQVAAWRQQVEAITQGYFHACSGAECDMAPDFVFNINVGATIGSLGAKFDVLEADPDYNPSLLVKDDGKCTGFVKLLPGNAELYTGQDTWTSFNSMTRVYKTIDTAFKRADGSVIPGHRQAFSSYPGSVFSGDDYYTLSSGLTVCETTIGTYNKTSLEFITYDTVYESARNTVANRLASSGQEWSQLFGEHNNGCYCNQFYVTDYNKFTPGKRPQPGTLWVLEQLPGYVQSRDMTDMLVEQGYFGSYNLPMFEETILLSNISAIVAEYGDWFTYNHTARANIMRRDHAKVASVEAMRNFMRYNDFKHDPLARCPCTPPYTGENAIACRSDLNPANGTYNIPAFKQRNHAATDSKFTTAALMAKGQRSWAISSPTYVQQPVFVWSTSPYASVSHIGQPDRWEFPWLTVGFPPETDE